MKLPPMDFQFEINLKGKVTGKLYTGSFTYRRLSIGSQGKAGVLKTRLNGDMRNVDPDVEALHEMISWLRYGITEYPDWWRECKFGEDLYDINVLRELYNRVLDFESKWEKQVEANVESNTENSNS